MKNSSQKKKGIYNLEQYSVVDKDKATLSYFITESEYVKALNFYQEIQTNKFICCYDPKALNMRLKFLL